MEKKAQAREIFQLIMLSEKRLFKVLEEAINIISIPCFPSTLILFKDLALSSSNLKLQVFPRVSIPPTNNTVPVLHRII